MNTYYQLAEQRPILFKNSENKKNIRLVSNEEEQLIIEKTLNTKTGIVYEDQYIIVLNDPVVLSNDEYGVYVRMALILTLLEVDVSC